ncbi:MAG TPA: ATP-dependent helicase HrpB, partial [Chloroflexota bacterium]|nr:ATP-dependent helicase HrpB [Chloroflexota bacterium]
MDLLPIENSLPSLRRALGNGRNAILTAPPGAGKTTRVPLALLDEPWLQGRRIIMLEPRRLAVRAAAHFMAVTLGEAVGRTVGYRMRLDTMVGPTTRIEVVTEGILTRLLQHDPSLAEYGIVIFDEFHERSLHADLDLALCLETQRLLRPDLRLLVMSATLDCEKVADLLDHAPVIACEGRLFPVDTRYQDRPASGPLDQEVVRIVQRALKQERGSLLVFLPGMAEIRRVERRLLESRLDSTVLIAPLHGDLPQEAQDQAVMPAAPGTRKIVLATSIAETSLTIDGIRIVIDAGFLRTPRFDPRTGLTRLETIRVTQDSAEQRRGRAGRLEPGVCYRLWTAAEQQTLAARRPPEILDADLAPMLLELALWGAADPYDLSWMDPPPAGAVAQAKDLLTRLGALDDRGRITPHGRQMAELALHPRLAHMILNAIPLNLGGLACEVAALLSERDLLRSQPGWRNADLRLRLDMLHKVQARGERPRARGHRKLEGPTGTGVDRSACQRVRRVAEQWQRQLRVPASESGDLERLGVLLAFAYPDRIAQRQRGTDRRYLLANGRGASFPQPEPLASEDYLVIADLDAGAQWARIDLAAPISQEDLETYCGDQIRDVETLWWDDRTQAVRARRQRRLG